MEIVFQFIIIFKFVGVTLWMSKNIEPSAYKHKYQISQLPGNITSNRFHAINYELIEWQMFNHTYWYSRVKPHPTAIFDPDAAEKKVVFIITEFG